MLRILKKIGFKEKYKLEEVFTPASSANVAYIRRENVEKQLNKALGIQGKQIVIYGHSGSGKTTVLTHMLQEKSLKKVVSRCTKSSTMDSIMLDAFDALDAYYVDSKIWGRKSSIVGKRAKEYKGIKSEISGSIEYSIGETQKRILPPQLTIQRLALFLGEAQAIWVIEDFHKVDAMEKTKISQMMKMFMDMSNEYPKIKIVVLGAADNGDEVVDYDNELVNRVTQIEVPLLSKEEISQVIIKGTQALNVKFTDNLIEQIAKYSNCLATIAHQLAYNLCFNRGITKTQKKHVDISESELENAINDFTNEKQDTYKKLYFNITKQREGKYRNVEIILRAIVEIDKEEITQHEIFSQITKKYEEYPPGNLSVYLKKLISTECEEVLRNNAGRFSFSDPFFKSYLKMRPIKNE